MSRSGYVDDGEQWQMVCWRGAVLSAINGRRGQAMLKELLAALDAMPVKELITNQLKADGAYCTLGVLGEAKGIAIDELDPEDTEQVADAFGIAHALAAEIVFENDECGWNDTPEQRWVRMREWVAKQIKE